MKRIDALRRNGAIFWPASVTDAIIDKGSKKSISGLLKKYNLSTLWPTGGISGSSKYNLELALEEISWRLKDNISPGIIIEFLNESGIIETWQLHSTVPGYIKRPIWTESFSSSDDITNWRTSNNSAVNWVENYKGRSGLFYKGGTEYVSFTRDLSNLDLYHNNYYIEFDALFATGNYADSISQLALTLNPTEPASARYQGPAIFEINSRGLGSSIFDIKGANVEVDLDKNYWNHFKLHISSHHVDFVISSDKKRLVSGGYDINFASNLIQTIYFCLGKTGEVDCYDYVSNFQIYLLADNILNVESAYECTFDSSNWVKINLSEELKTLELSSTNRDAELTDLINAETSARENRETSLQNQLNNVGRTFDNEVARAIHEEDLINKKLNDEIALRDTQKTELDSTISNLETKEDRAITSLDTKLTNQINSTESELESAIETSETRLQQSIDSNTSRITNVEDSVTVLRSDLNTEKSNRTVGDQTLQSNIDNLSATVNTNKQNAESLIASETALREDADSTLQGNINTTNTNLAAEITRATTEETAIRSEMSTEFSEFSVNDFDLATDEEIEAMFNTGE